MFQIVILDSLKIIQKKYNDVYGLEETTRDLDRLCSKTGIEVSDDLLLFEGSQDVADTNSDFELDLDDISDGSGIIAWLVLENQLY